MTAISNSGHDERGKYIGGKAGDQADEWVVRSWYNRPWNCVMRYPDAKVQRKIAELAQKAANNRHIGYDQGAHDRMTFWTQLQKVGYDPAKITVDCEQDCSSGVIAIVKAVGHLLGIKKLQEIKATYTGNMRTAFKSAGFQVLTAGKYLSSDQYLLPGDILLNDKSHTAINLTAGSKAGAGSAPVVSACPYPEPVGYIIQRGSIGNGAKWVQWYLVKHGYDIGKSGIDGIVGSKTDAAIRAFQKAKKLTIDGQVGPLTRAALKK